MSSDSALLCENLRFQYEDGPSEVLRGVDLNVHRGEFVVIAGPSGEGKSTLCRTFNNIIPMFYKGRLSGKRQTAGIWLDSQKISEVAKRIGMVFQDFEQQLFSTNASLELAFGLENFGVSTETMKQRISEMLERFGISHLADREPFSMSGGEKQKLAIASVLAYRPEILVLDEPTTDLDPESRSFVLEVLPQLKDWVETVVVVDQETEQLQIAERIMLFREGRIQAEGSPPEILSRDDLLESNSLAAPDLIKLQKNLGWQPKLLNLHAMESALAGYRLQKIPTPQRTSAPAIVEVDALSHNYEGQATPALEDVSFEIREGEFLGIVGHNGSGKSTLLRHLNGLQLPQQGTVRIAGKDVKQWNRKDLARTAGLVFQNPDHQIFNPTVREEVEFGPQQFGFPDEQQNQNVQRAIETMDLLGQVDRDPLQLSKGERQRVAVASVLSIAPRILILDEPTTGLDYRQQTYLMKLLTELNHAGTTVVIVTHALKLVGHYCTYAMLLDNGRKVAEGHPRELFFGSADVVKTPSLWRLAARLGGNALNPAEFAGSLRKEP